MRDELREYSIMIWPIEGLSGSMLVNLYATSVSGRPQIHCKCMGVKWAEILNKTRPLPICESYDIDSIELLLRKTPCDLHVRCRMSDLEAIGFTYS